MVLRDRPSFSQRLSAKRSSVAEDDSESAFMLQEPALDAELETLPGRAHEAADGAARADHAMARDHDGDGIRPACPAHGARRRADRAGDLAVAQGLARANALHRFPDRDSMARPGDGERKVELEARIVQVRLDLRAREVRD